jgi:hypothetical protein
LSSRVVDASGSSDAAEAGRNLRFVVVFDPMEGVEFRLDDFASVGPQIPTNCREHESSGEDDRVPIKNGTCTSRCSTSVAAT